MMLKGKVVAVESGAEYVDQKQRVTIAIEGADSGYRKLRIASDSFVLDQEVSVEIRPSGADEEISNAYEEYRRVKEGQSAS